MTSKKSSTSLARQLEKLKLPQTSSQQEHYGAVSFLYDFFQAKTISLDQHYSIAINSLENLIQIDAKFNQYKKTLFNESKKHYDRRTDTRKSNELLDLEIEKFLYQISKYFQLTDTHKILEYLIQRYQINEFNHNVLISSLLPYHETRLFVRLMQTCSAIKNPQNFRFYWMKKYQENGVPISKQNLLKYCCSNKEFITYVIDSIFQSFKYEQQNTLIQSFLLSFCLNLLQYSNYKDDMVISNVLSIISRCLRYKNDRDSQDTRQNLPQQLTSIALMIFSHLCDQVRLDLKIVTKILRLFFSKDDDNDSKLSRSTFIAFEIIVKTQDLIDLPRDFIQKNFLNQLITINGQTADYDDGGDNGDGGIKLESLPMTIVINIIRQNDREKFDEQIYRNYLHILIETFGNSPYFVRSIIQWINNDCDDNDQLSYRFIAYTLKLIEKFYPQYFKSSLQQLRSIRRTIRKYLREQNQLRYKLVDNQLPLFLRIDDDDNSNNNNLSNRKYLEFFLENIQQNDLNSTTIEDRVFVHKILMKILKQQFSLKNIEILQKILMIKDNLFEILSIDEFNTIVQTLLLQINEKLLENNESIDEENVLKLKQTIVEIYCKKSYSDYYHSTLNQPENDNFIQQLFADNVQQMLILNLLSTDYRLSMKILASDYARTNPMLRYLAENMADSMSYSKYKSIDNEERQMEILKSFAMNVLENLVKFLRQNRNEYFHEANFIEKLSMTSNAGTNIRFKFLFQYLIVKLIQQYRNEMIEMNQIYQFAIDLFVHLLNLGIEIASKSELKIKTISDYEPLRQEMDNYFLFEFFNFDTKSISLFLIGYIVYNLINIDYKSEKLSADWYLMDYQCPNNQFMIAQDLHYKLYLIFMKYSEVSTADINDGTKKKARRISKLFQQLFGEFLLNRLESYGFEFLLPFIIGFNGDNLVIKQKTLLIMNQLMQKSTKTSKILLKSLEMNPKYLLIYLLSLQSSTLSIRQLSLTNLKQILVVIKANSNDNSNDDMKKILRKITNEKSMILIDSMHISTLIGKIQPNSSLLNKLLANMTMKIISKDLMIRKDIRISILRLLRCCNVETKSKIIRHYLDLLTKSSTLSDKSRELEQELFEIVDFYNYNLFENDENLDKLFEIEDESMLQFLLVSLETFALKFSEKLFEKALNTIKVERFVKILTKNPNYSLQLLSKLLEIQLLLSEAANQPHRSTQINMINDLLRKLFQTTAMDENFLIQLMNSIVAIDEIYEQISLNDDDNNNHSQPKRLKLSSIIDDNRVMESANERQKQIKWKLLRILLLILSNVKLNQNDNILLLNELFGYLKLTFMNLDDNFQELTRQTILYEMMNLIESRFNDFKIASESKMAVDGVDPNDDDNDLQKFINAINVDLIIDCIKESKVKETQRIALSLLNLIAPYFHKQILEYLVTIFTFIGTNLLECDDQYSLKILFDTMESIIPIIIERNQVGSSDGYGDNEEDNDKKLMIKQFIVKIFIKSFNDIPSHRRLQLYVKLINLLGSDQYLPIILINLMEKILQTNKSNDSSTTIANMENDLEFLRILFEQFPHEIRLRALNSMLYLFQAKYLQREKRLSAKSSDLSLLITKSHDNEQQNERIGQQIQQYSMDIRMINRRFKSIFINDSLKYECGSLMLKFILKILSSSDSIHTNIDLKIPLIYSINLIFESIILINQNDALQPMATKSKNHYRKQYKTLIDNIFIEYNKLIPDMLLLEIINDNLLNNTMIIQSSVDHNSNDSSTTMLLIKRKTIELLNEYLRKLSENSIDQNILMKICSTLLKQLQMYNENLSNLTDNQIHTIQLILLSFKLLTKYFTEESENSNEILLKILQEIIQMITMIDEQMKPADEKLRMTKLMQNLRTSSLLCMSQVLITLSNNGIEHLNIVIELILLNFTKQHDSEDLITTISNITSIFKIITKFSPFLSPYLRSIILNILPLFQLIENMTTSNNLLDLKQKLQKLWTNIARLVPKRIVFECIDRIYDDIITEDKLPPMTIVPLMNLLKSSIGYMEKIDLESIVKNNLNVFMMKTLAFRSKFHQKLQSNDHLELIETTICETLSEFIPKLNETNFRPLFDSLLEWSSIINNPGIEDFTDSSIKAPKDNQLIQIDNQTYYQIADEHLYRLQSFYKFCSFLIDRLKNLFCIFILPNIMKNCQQILSGYHSKLARKSAIDDQSSIDEQLKEDNGQKQVPKLLVTNHEIGEPLTQSILLILSKCFMYDLNDTFTNVNDESITMLIRSIIDQISNIFVDHNEMEHYEQRLQLINQCIQYLVQNNRDETLIKELNYQILLQTQNTQLKVKIAAIKVLHHLILTCNEDYLPFIPESMTFIAELSEMDSFEIESQLKQLIIDLEQLIGEPIDKYL